MNTAIRHIGVVTGTRADYGLLYWTLRAIQDDPVLRLQLLVTGAHLSPQFGSTYQDIEAQGFEIAARIDLQLGDDSETGTGWAMGRAVGGFATALGRLKPDLLVVLGDRYEILAAATAAMFHRIPIVHLHGGESTEGLIDEAVRHAVTKMSHVHCVAAEPYARRVIQMGEQPDKVHVVGATGFDQLERTELLSRAALEAELNMALGPTNFLLTLHPETLSDATAEQQVQPLLDGLSCFPDARIFITGSNADPAGRRISRQLQDYAETNPDRCCYRESLGQRRYLSLMRQVDVVIGNSSSGIIEAPAMGKAVVNIGKRQHNRLRAAAIIDCRNQANAIAAAIASALQPDFAELAARRETPYGSPGAAQRITRILRETRLDGILAKRFHDLDLPVNPHS